MSLARRAFVLSLVLPSVARAQDGGPTAPIAALNAALQVAMRAGRTTQFAARVAALRPVVERAFDLAAILRASVGPRFAGFDAATKRDLLEAFSAFTVATWVANFNTDGGESFEVAPQTRAIGEDQVVSTRIVPKSGEATRLDYVMRLGPGQGATQGAAGAPAGWKAVDILLNGTISRVAVQRSDFRGLLAGGDPAPLLASLRSRYGLLAGGS